MSEEIADELSTSAHTSPLHLPTPGDDVQVWWEDRDETFEGRLASRQGRPRSFRFMIHYNDGDKLMTNLNDCFWRYCSSDGTYARDLWYGPGEVDELWRDISEKTFEANAYKAVDTESSDVDDKDNRVGHLRTRKTRSKKRKMRTTAAESRKCLVRLRLRQAQKGAESVHPGQVQDVHVKSNQGSKTRERFKISAPRSVEGSAMLSLLKTKLSGTETAPYADSQNSNEENYDSDDDETIREGRVKWHAVEDWSPTAINLEWETMRGSFVALRKRHNIKHLLSAPSSSL